VTGVSVSGTSRLGPRERAARGRAAREVLPPADQGELALPRERPSTVSILEQQAKTRVPDLVPVRHGRMAVTPFTFFRGHALGMAIDLGASPVSGLKVQLCGDAHLSNFGVFASPERRLLFDINDFDESLPGPWEWDVKRLATSIVLVGRENGFSRKERRKCAQQAVRRYRDAIAEFATMRTLDVWYARADIEEVRGALSSQLSAKRRQSVDKNLAKARANDSLKALAKLTETVDGQVRFKSDPPLLVPIADLMPDADRDDLAARISELLAGYARSLTSDRQALYGQFQFLDLARKVVGVGSVGTRCWIALLQGRDDGDPLLLQIKEAQSSVLERNVPSDMRPRPRITNEGKRVVAGQRLMQAASDIFLGWQRIEGIDGLERDFYVRQLRDMKGSAVVENLDPQSLAIYGQLCGWTLARAHARSGDAIAVAAYLGDDDDFSQAIAAFAELYADHTEREHAALLEAIRSGRLPAETGV
jgi:uncharacterized protein (DUF2252 family)